MALSSEEFRKYLQSGERIVWTGRPQQGVVFRSRDILLIPFSLLWMVFVVFWEGAVLFASAHSPAVWPMAAFGGVFILVGLFMTVGRFFVDAWARSRINYALTDRRALILNRMFGERLTAVKLLNCPLRLSLSGSRGDIDFESQSWTPLGRSVGIWMPSLSGGARFIGIEGASDVYRQVQELSERVP